MQRLYWREENFADRATIFKQHSIKLPNAPVFSIVVPLYKTPKTLFDEMLGSVLHQSYERWELLLVNASPEDDALSGAVAGASKRDPRVKVLTLEKNLGISANTNAGVAQTTGEFVCFLDHDDTLEPDALFEYARTVIEHPETDLIYSDEDKLSPDGELINPFFKPDFSIDLLRNVNYICHFLAVRRSLLVGLEPSTPEVDGAQDHDLTLKAVEHARRVHHVARVLYHWRMAEGSTALNPQTKSYALQSGVRAVQNHLSRVGIDAQVSADPSIPFTYRVRYALPTPDPLVSIIIPSKDHTDVLDVCIRSIIERSTYRNFEIVIVENNSVETDTFAYYRELETRFPDVVRIVTWHEEFNFSKIVNFGVSKASGDYLLLLNNDTEVITPDWLEELLGICSRDDVGAVGVRLLYADDTVQHAGVVVNGKGAGHLFKDFPDSDPGYFGLSLRVQDLSAVTAACLMTKRSAFELVNGFSEEFAVAFNDVDFCLKLREAGRLVVYTPYAKLYHYESLSRGYEDGIEKQLRFHREASLLGLRWPRHHVVGDPYINLNILPDNDRYQIYLES